MKKLAKIDENCNLLVFMGDDTAWAISEGFKEMDVVQCFNGQWILEKDAKKPEYQAKELEHKKLERIAQIEDELKMIDAKRIRAIAEPKTRHDGLTWLEFYTNQIMELRAEKAELEK